jgi:transglutaminase-like putative cysteine protease
MPSTPAASPIDRRQFLRLAAGTGAAVTGSLLLPAAGRGVVTPPRRTTVAATATALGSISDLAASLDHDVERIFRFVSEEIRYEPYVGILRGARGALLGRSGNSADQALLLAELLAASGISYRYASGAIDDATAGAILGAGVTDVVTARDDAFRVLVADAQAAVAPGAPSASPDLEQDAIIASIEADAPAIIATAARQLQDSVSTIMAALADAGITLPEAVPTLPERERTQHVWIQAASGTDWVDLDPTLPTTLLGESLTSADITMDALPDDLRHRVEFVAIAESWAAGQLTQTPVLEYATYADMVQGVPIAFTNAKSDDLGINIIGNVGGGSAQYTTVLEVGPQVFIGTIPLSLGSSGSGFFGESPDGEAGGLLEGEASAEWLEVRVTSPDADPVVARRTIFDRIGDAMRLSGTVDPFAIAPVQLVESGEGFGEYPPLMTVHAFSVVGGPLSGLAMLEPLKKRRLGVYSYAALAYHYLRDSLASEIGLEQGVRMLIDRPGVVSLTLDFTPGVALEMSLALDIWHRSFATAPIADRAAAAHPAVIVDGSTGTSGPVSVGAIFDLARSQGIPVRVIQGSLPAGSSYPPEALSLITAALDAGRLVVVPERAVEVAGRPRLGWWLVDPATGRTEDQLDNGRGAGTVEYGGTSMAGWVRALVCITAVGEFFFIGWSLMAGTLGEQKLATVGAFGIAFFKLITIDSGAVLRKACVTGVW